MNLINVAKAVYKSATHSDGMIKNYCKNTKSGIKSIFTGDNVHKARSMAKGPFNNPEIEKLAEKATLLEKSSKSYNTGFVNLCDPKNIKVFENFLNIIC